MKNLLYFVRRTYGILFAVLFLISACRMPEPQPTAAEPTRTPQITAAATEQPIADQPTEAPTAEPTEAPTAEPTRAPVSDDEMNRGALDAFFDDSLLIGDSLTAGFTSYFEYRRAKEGQCLGTLKGIGQSAYFLEKAYDIEVGKRPALLSYRGHKYSVSDLTKAISPKALYLLLGVDDIYHNSVEDNISFYDEIIRNTREKVPGIRIVLITVPPVLKNYARNFGYDPEINVSVNAALYTYCAENGLGLIELAERVRGKDGFLDPAYCSDEKFHLNNSGRELWLAAMREYAREQYDAGAWTPED